MNFRDRPVAVWAFPLAMLVAALLVLGSGIGNFASSLRNALFDSYQRSAPRAFEDTGAKAGFPVRVLDIDENALARFGPWPWPHALLGRVISELKDQGAALVVLSFPLEQPDRAAPKELAAQLPTEPAYDNARSVLAQLPGPDDSLAKAIASVKSVTGFTLGAATTSRAPVLKASFLYLGTKQPFAHAHAFDQASGAIPEVERASAGIGALNIAVDPDGRVRRMPLLFRFQNKIAPSLDAETLRVARGKSAITVRSDEGDRGVLAGVAGVAAISTGEAELPTSPDGSLWLAFSGSNAARNVSASALGANALSPGSLKNAIVYIGAPNDLVATPSGQRPVAEIHAEAMENILLGTPLRRPPTASIAELICLAIFGGAAVFLFARAGVLWTGLFTVVAIAAGLAISFRLYTADRVLFDALGPSVGLATVFAAGALARGFDLALSRAKLRSAFADSLPVEAIDRIARKPQLLKLEGETRTVTYLACGIRGFAGLATSFRDDPASFTRLVQRVLTPLMDEALSHGGTIDRLTSEGFTAFWNAPLDDPEHAIHACEAASRMTEVMARVNDAVTHERRIDGVAFAPVEIGLGISTGPAIAGGFRAHGRTAYAVNGDCTVVAARIQSLSTQYGPAVVVSEATRKASERGFAFLEVDYLTCGAQDEPVKLYAMLGNPVVRASPKFRALMTFHEHIFNSLRTQQWSKARALIEQCRKLSGASQKLYDLHLARITYFESNPPGAEWDGAFRPILK
jgi:adenylate cyclase